MIKKIKMMLYGAPGVGKSVFASKFPKPFFITTDGNYEWLEDFGAKEEDHKQINNYKDFVTFIKTANFNKYDTIVIDLIEDLFMWCEDEFCNKNKIDYVGDLGFGKGFKITRDDFFVEISKLLSLDKNVILISHESYEVIKDKRGVENTIYSPSKLIPDKLRDQLEGRLRYVLRAKFEDVINPDNKIKMKRVLSLAKNSNEFSIIRGVDMDTIQDTIDLDYNQFIKELKLDKVSTTKKEIKDNVKKEVKIETKETKIEEPKISIKVEEVTDKVVIPEEIKEVKKEVKVEKNKEKTTSPKEEVEETKTETKEDIIASIRAKIAALNKK